MKIKLTIFCFSIAVAFYSTAQDSSLLNMLNDSINLSKQTTYATSAFKGTHVINLQTPEAPGQGALNFIIMHRFGKLNDAYNFFGLDNASIRLGLDYGITDKLSVGIGRSSYEKTFDGYFKFKALQQTDNDKVPLTVSLFGGLTHYTLKYSDKSYLNTTYRTIYTAQLLMTRKFSRKFSLEVAPAFMHYNLVPTVADNNNIFALGMGGRMKITKRMSINAEYNYLPSGQVTSVAVRNSFSTGIDIETGGHVFQLVLSNSQGMTEPQYITRTTGSWGKGDIYFGFNISRNFNITRHSKAGGEKKW